ncbi:MAG: glutamate 5-kinase [Candidatus Altiarchaeota archaeon]
MEKKPKRVVIKVGTSSLTQGYKLSPGKVSILVSEVMKLRKKGVEVIIVSSGAIAAGMGELGLGQRPRELKALQATAAVGQNELMKAYGKAFARYGQKVGQVLLTREEFSERKSYLNIQNTLNALIKMNVVPIINENDSVSVEEIVSGDNDNLAAIVAVNLAADALVMLSDSGFKMSKEDEKVVPVIPAITMEIRKASGGGGKTGKGGMITKIQAAEKTMKANVDMLIVDAKKKGAIARILFNPSKKVLVSQNATLFPSTRKLTDREHWLIYSSRAAGDVTVDDGAKKALAGGGSLLPSGVIKVSGLFKAGDVVRIIDSQGREFARGIINHSAEDLSKIRGKHTKEIEKILSRKCKCEVVYHGNMSLIEP